MKLKPRYALARSLMPLGAICILLLALSPAMIAAPAAAGDDAARAPDGVAGDTADTAVNDAALKQVVAGFSNGWNTHDARAMCSALADDVHWVNWRGEVSPSRQAVEDEHAKLFAGLYIKTQRTDTVKTIRYLGPDLALVDDYWTMTGARTRDGAEWPYRAGYVNFVMAKREGRWIIVVSHTADFNAKAPATN